MTFEPAKNVKSYKLYCHIYLCPVFIVLIVMAMKDLLDYKTGYSFYVKEMEIPSPVLTVCPVDYIYLLPPEAAFRALSYSNDIVLPINVSMFWLLGSETFR